MQKLTLQFVCLSELSSFSKKLSTGFLLNTTNLTLTGNLAETQVRLAKEQHQAILVATTDKVYSYDKLI